MSNTSATPLLRTRGLTLNFGAVNAADDIDFELHQGEHLAVIGANGAGKTTFINICTGYIKPTGGTVYFTGQDITHKSPRQITRLGIGRSFQLPQLFLEHSVQECLQLASVAHGRKISRWVPLAQNADEKAIAETLELVDLKPYKHDLAAALPEGHRKLLDVAIALVLQPRLMIMDEPTSGVSSEDKHALMRTVMAALQYRNITSWFVEHDIDIVLAHATRVAAWIDGRVVADSDPRTVFNDPTVRREILGER